MLVRSRSAYSFGIAATALALGAIALPALASAPVPILTSVQVNRRGEAQEIHFEFEGQAPRMQLSTHGSELSIDLGGARIEVPPRPLYGLESPPVATLRAIDEGGRSQIVIAVAGKADYAIARLPHEILLRIAPAGAVPNLAAPILVHNDSVPKRLQTTHRALASAAAAAPAVPDYRYRGPAIERPRPTEVEPLDIAAPAAGHPLVMIDPGHGGFDPGTESVSGLREKDLALQIALEVERALEESGIRAEMTRSTDDFISLHDRTQVANSAGADLFLSIHLNSSPNPGTTGIEVYYLNNTTDRATIRLARMENGGTADYGAGEDSNLNYILADLRQNYKANESASLARMIDAQTVADLSAGLGVEVNALGAKMGPFYVLVGAHMPAVLVECGFLSNSGEAKRLSSAQYQELLADGIAEAVRHYLSEDAAVGNL
jgi:N-acetylmuramoyl-L-alanine amidase